MAVPAVLLCDFHTSHLTVDITSPHFKSNFQARHSYHGISFFVAGGWIKSQARGHVDPPDPERWGAVEIATRRRPRLQVVLDLSLRPRLAWFYDRALCSDFASHARTRHFGVGRTIHFGVCSVCDRFNWNGSAVVLQQLWCPAALDTGSSSKAPYYAPGTRYRVPGTAIFRLWCSTPLKCGCWNEANVSPSKILQSNSLS